MPLTVPPVPTPTTRTSSSSPSASQISGPVGRDVRGRVVGVGVLVGLPGVRRLLGQAPRDGVVGARVVRLDVGRADDHLGAERAQGVDLLPRHLVGHDEDAAVALLGGGHGEAEAGVAAGRLDDGAAGLELALALGGLDHRQRDPVLDRAARIEVLELGQEPRTAGRLEVRQPHDGRVADEVGENGELAHAAILPTRCGRVPRRAHAIRSALRGRSRPRAWRRSSVGQSRGIIILVS